MYTVIDITISITCEHYYAICNSEQVTEVAEVIERMIDEADSQDDFCFDEIIEYVTSNFDCAFPDVEHICK